MHRERYTYIYIYIYIYIAGSPNGYCSHGEVSVAETMDAANPWRM